MNELPKPKGDTGTMRMPISKPGGAKFRGPTSSHEYNRNEDDKYYDLIELYKQSNITQLSLKEAHQAILAENIVLNNYVKMLEDRIANLESQLVSLEESSYLQGQFFKTSFVQDMSTSYPSEIQDSGDLTPRCKKDLQYRHVTLPQIHQIPKTHLVDEYGNHIVPSDLKVKVGRSGTKGIVVDNNILNAFDGDSTTFWRRTVTYDSVADIPEDGEDVILEIELPTRLVNNLNINTMVLHPHPEKGIEIKNIEIQHNNAWQTIPGFRQNEITSIKSDHHSPRKKWFFPSVPVQKIRITLVQHHPINMGGKTVFVLGAQEIGVYLTTFEPSGGMILTPFDMDGIYNIENVEHVFLNRKALSYPENMDHLLDGNIYNYEIFIEEPDKTLRPLQPSEWNSQTAKRLWIKTRLFPDPNNGVNPCLHAVRLHYTKV